MNTNVGLLYNKHYFNDLQRERDGNWVKKRDTIMPYILSVKLEKDLAPKIGTNSFILKTVYPGLLSGSGYKHAVGGKDIENEFQLGYYFDHTTGLPVIPGSSIKGVLRDACEMRGGDYLIDILKSIEASTASDLDVEKFIQEVFEGMDGKRGVPLYNRDIFFDAFPILSNGNLFGNDYITHHEHPLQDPNPVQFLRVQPEVNFKFCFQLNDIGGVSAEDKIKLFKRIILDIGLGAKTNVGYGQFIELSTEDRKKAFNSSAKNKYEPSLNAISYKKDNIIEVTVIDINDYFTFKDEQESYFRKKVDAVNKKFERVLEKKRKKKPHLAIKDLKIGDKVKLKFNNDLTEDKLNFSVLPIYLNI